MNLSCIWFSFFFLLNIMFFLLKNDSKSYTRSIFHICNGTYYLDLFNYLSNCLLTYLLVSGTTTFLVVYLFDFLLIVSGYSGKWMEK